MKSFAPPPLLLDETRRKGVHEALKRAALIAIIILLALALSACGETALEAVAPEATPTLSSKLLASVRSEGGTHPTDTLPQLVTEEHILYLKPLSDELVQPDEPITRGDAIASLYALMANPIAGGCSFSDVHEGDALYEALCCMTGWGVVSDSEGAFDPDGLLSRAQLVTMLSRFYPAEPEDVEAPYVGSFRRRSAEMERVGDMGIPSFTDSADHWASAAIENAVDRGWIDAGGKFYPDAAVTRGMFCRIINRVLGRHGDEAVAVLSGDYEFFTDLPSSHEYYADILEATCSHEYYYGDDGTERWSSEVLEEGLHRADGRLYYVQTDGTLLRNDRVQQWDFDENGRYTTGLEELDDMIRDILLEIGADDMSQSEALRAAYLYCTHGHTYIYHNWYTYGFDDVHDENAFRALRFFQSGGGYCYDYAAGFGLLARALGYNCYIVQAQVNENYAPHGFVVIPENGVNYIYDPELESMRPARHADYGLFRITNGSIYRYWYSPWW